MIKVLFFYFVLLYNCHGDDMKKRKIKIKNILILFIILVIIIFTLLVLFNKNNASLKSIGYNSLEIKELEKLSEQELNIIYKYDYNKNLIYIVTSDNYNKDKLDLYIKYTLDNDDYLKIFNLINSKEFKEENVDKYMKYIKKFNNTDGIIKYVNNNYNFELNDASLSFLNEKYFIIDYLDRYLNYYESNKDLEYKEIITRVNSNLDYEFYVDTNESDLSKGMYTLVNKYNYLKQDYVPDDLVSVTGIYARDSAKLVKVAYDNFVKMADAAREQDLTIKVTTGYRSYSFQSTLYNNYVKADGVKNADTYSARPGFSEHQLGYSADLTNAKNVSFDNFENTKEYKWLQDNAYKYGFIMRFPKGKEYITGYQFESWHYRYVGEKIATYIHENDITYEEYYAYYLR